MSVPGLDTGRRCPGRQRFLPPCCSLIPAPCACVSPAAGELEVCFSRQRLWPRCQAFMGRGTSPGPACPPTGPAALWEAGIALHQKRVAKESLCTAPGTVPGVAVLCTAIPSHRIHHHSRPALPLQLPSAICPRCLCFRRHSDTGSPPWLASLPAAIMASHLGLCAHSYLLPAYLALCISTCAVSKNFSAHKVLCPCSFSHSCFAIL